MYNHLPKSAQTKFYGKKKEEMSRKPSHRAALRIITYLKWISEQKGKGGGDLHPPVSMPHRKIFLYTTKSTHLEENHSV